jgi:hypothetical protein
LKKIFRRRCQNICCNKFAAKAFISSQLFDLEIRVARWFIFEPKIALWVNFGRLLNGKGFFLFTMAIWNIVRPFGIFYGHLAIKWKFGAFSSVLVFCVKKNLATMLGIANSDSGDFGTTRRRNTFRQSQHYFSE